LRPFGLAPHFVSVAASLMCIRNHRHRRLASHQYQQAQLRQFGEGRDRDQVTQLVLEAHMPRTGLMPNAVSSRADKEVYLVVDRRRGVRRKTRVERTDIETIISKLIAGQFNDPLRVVAFNTIERWSEDISKYLAEEIQARCDIEAMPVPEHIRDFVVSYTG
jgi:hypothetical protein